jgi:hypothetical protein
VNSIFDKLTAKPPSDPQGQEMAKELAHVAADSPPADAYTPRHATPRQVKDTTLELLKYGLLESFRKPNLYKLALTHGETIARILEPLDLALKVDDIRGLAYLVIAEQGSGANEDEWSHPLVRRLRLNMEQSLLIAILRQQFIAHEQAAGVGVGEAIVSLDDLLLQLQTYLGDMGSDQQEQKRLRNLLEQLKGHGIVSDVDADEQVAIRPIIAHLANPQNLQSLLNAYRQEARGNGGAVVQPVPQDEP